jgi:hypothetical protein
MIRQQTRLAIALSLCAFGAVSCQEVEQPTTVLTQEQWNEVKSNILEEAPTPKYKVGARFDDKIELVGFDVSEPIEAGKPATFTWYWKVLDEVDKNWKIFVHFDSTVKPLRQNLDHVPIDGMYPTSRWKKGQVIKDVQTVTMRNDMPAGPAVPYIGFWRGTDRMKVTNDVKITSEAQPRVVGPTLTIKSGGAAAEPAAKAKKEYALRKLAAEDVADMTLDGRMQEAAWKKAPLLRLLPFPGAPELPTTVRAFITDTDLWIGARMADERVWGERKERDAETWKEEVLEVFIDVDGDGNDYLEFQITPLGTVFDANFKKRLGRGEGSREDQIAAAKAFNIEGLETAVHVDGTLNKDDDKDRAWMAEAKIPLASIPGIAEGGPKAGDTWAVNVYRFDRPADGKTFAYAWSTEPRGDFHQVDKFGQWRVSPTIPLKRPVITREVMEQIKKNVDLKVRNRPGAENNGEQPAQGKPANPPKPGEGSGTNDGTE